MPVKVDSKTQPKRDVMTTKTFAVLVSNVIAHFMKVHPVFGCSDPAVCADRCATGYG